MSKLLPQHLRRKLPSLMTNANEADPVAQVKFFATWSDWQWYAIEFDGDDLMFGLVCGFEVELGYFRLSELEAGSGMTAIERDEHFEPTKVSLLRARQR